MVTKTMKRSDIRYALYRCKNKCAETKHQEIYNFYSNDLEELGLDASDFAVEGGWDINKSDITQIVTGKTVKKYLDELSAPTFGINK